MSAQGGNVGGGAEELVAAARQAWPWNGPFPKRLPQKSEANMVLWSSHVLLASSFKFAQLGRRMLRWS